MINLEEQESGLELDIDASLSIEDDGFDGDSHLEELQRTEQWQEERKGNWTGSAIKELMSCGRSGGRKSWNDNFKYLDFGKGALKYIFSNAMERKTGRYIETSTTAEMMYGTVTEPLTFKRANAELNKKGLMLKQVGFKVFPDIPTAGVSSDAVVVKIDNPEEIVASAEIKACTSWGTFFERTFEKTSETSKDFWQTIAQCKAWDVDKVFYIVISPPKNFRKYTNKDTVEDFYDDWVSETEMNIEEIKASEIHIKNMVRRIEIGERVIFKYLESGNNISEILDDEISRERDYLLESLNAEEKEDDDGLSDFERRMLKEEESVPLEDEEIKGKEIIQEEKQQKVKNNSGLTPELFDFDDSPF